MDQLGLAKLKIFATGTASVPIGGFKNLLSQNHKCKFTIKRITMLNSKFVPLPVAHACFNQIDLPDYSSYEVLARKLKQAIDETDSFEMV